VTRPVEPKAPKLAAAAVDKHRHAEQIVTCCRVLAGEGLAAGFGHVSRRVAGDSFIISGKVPLGTVTTDEVVAVTERGPEDGLAHLLPVEAAIHLAVYRARPDVNAIARTHGDFCSVLSILGEPVRAVHAFGAALGSEVPVYDACELIESREQARRLADVLGSASAVILRGNGAVVCGADLVEACVLAYYLEESARLQCQARCVQPAGRLRYLTSEESAAAAANLRSRPQLERAFKALCNRHHVSSWPGHVVTVPDP
jgi:HCOMODA/2-hydroxy-3-carboxy-muconic semialdehyde decarboxylase